MLEESATLIPAENVTGCEAWEMPTLAAVGSIISAAGKEKNMRERAADDPFTGPLTASKIEQIRESARAEGFAAGQQEGYRQGMQQAQTEVEEIQAQLNSVMGHLMQPIATQDKEVEVALVTLAAEIAQGVVQRSVDFDAEMMSSVVRQAIAGLPEASQHIRIFLNPADAELVGRAILQRASDWQVLPNAEIERGGCIVRSEHSFIDYTLEAQFQRMLAQILDTQFAAQREDSDGVPPEDPDSPSASV